MRPGRLRQPDPGGGPPPLLQRGPPQARAPATAGHHDHHHPRSEYQTRWSGGTGPGCGGVGSRAHNHGHDYGNGHGGGPRRSGRVGSADRANPGDQRLSAAGPGAPPRLVASRGAPAVRGHRDAPAAYRRRPGAATLAPGVALALVLPAGRSGGTAADRATRAPRVVTTTGLADTARPSGGSAPSGGTALGAIGSDRAGSHRPTRAFGAVGVRRAGHVPVAVHAAGAVKPAGAVHPAGAGEPANAGHRTAGGLPGTAPVPAPTGLAGGAAPLRRPARKVRDNQPASSVCAGQ